MRKVLLVAICALFAVPAAAGTFGINLSAWDANDVDNVLGGGVNFTVPFSKAFEFEARASYYEEAEAEPFDDYLFEGDSPFTDAGVKVLPIELGVRYNFMRDTTGMFHPYIGGGAAYYALDSSTGQLDDELGFYAAGGAAIGNREGVDFYFELAYRFVEGQVTDFGDLDDDGISDDFDIDLSGPALSAGILWNW